MSQKVRNTIFYGWVIVAIATLSLVVSNGLAVNGIPVFSEWIRNDLIASGAITPENAQKTVANFGILTFLVAGLSAPFAGYFIQKINLKIIMLLGCLILGGALLLQSLATSVGTVYLSRVLMGLSLSFIGVLATSVLVSNWFLRRRGTALGILFTGTSLGGIVIPLLATPIILKYGWRSAMIAVSLLVWLVLLPGVIFLVKTKPGDIGVLPDGEPAESGPESAAVQGSYGITLSAALKTPRFWVFALCAALIFYPLFVTTQQLILYLRSPRIGVTPETASFLQALMAALSIGGKFLFGFLSDRFSPTRVMLFCCALMFAATLVLFGLSAGTVLYFLVPFGLGYGGTFVLLQRLVADYFGTRDYSKILAAITVIETIGAAIGGAITGYVADLNGGDYGRAFYGVIIATGAALVLTFALNVMAGGRDTLAHQVQENV
jgi:MFS family permease